MRPPVCDVCDADVEPADAASLVSCVRAADARELGGLPGHPSHQLWLCTAHRDEGAALAASRTAAEVVAALREHPEPTGQPRAAGALACAPIELSDAVRAMRRALDRLAADHGLDAVDLESSERREWTPMDNVMPPDCPYVNHRLRRIARGGIEVTLAEEWAHWSDSNLARGSATLSLRSPAASFAVSAHTALSGDDRLVRELFVRGDAPPWLLDEFGAPQPR